MGVIISRHSGTTGYQNEIKRESEKGDRRVIAKVVAALGPTKRETRYTNRRQWRRRVNREGEFCFP